MLRHIVLGLLGCAVVSPLPTDAAPPPKLSLLIVDGMNNHDWPIRGCKWAASGEVTCWVPTNFPAAREIRINGRM